MTRLQRLNDALSHALNPVMLTIEDESNRHHVPEGAETHFKIIAVSSRFNDMNRVARHRMVNACVSQEFSSGMHALSLHLYTPDEWKKHAVTVLDSPKCRNGKHHN